MPCIIVTHTGRATGGIRKIPLMRVKVDDAYVLIGSMGGQPQNPAWVYNLRANPDVQIRDATEVFEMRVREVQEEAERQRLWDLSAEAYPPYNDYQAKRAGRSRYSWQSGLRFRRDLVSWIDFQVGSKSREIGIWPFAT